MTGFDGVSCILPAFNEAPRIGAVLAAVAAQRDVAEVIVVDDGSQDGTAEVAERHRDQVPGLRVLRMPRNGGKTACRASRTISPIANTTIRASKRPSAAMGDGSRGSVNSDR